MNLTFIGISVLFLKINKKLLQRVEWFSHDFILQPFPMHLVGGGKKGGILLHKDTNSLGLYQE